MTPLSASVVIPAFNCDRTIAKTIEAVLKQSIQVQNVVVVDDGSTDQTASIVKSFEKITYIYQKNAGPSTARNRGAREAKGDYVFFTDSDCIPQVNWIERAAIRFDDEKVGVVAGSYGIANNENLLARCVYKEIYFRHHQLMPEYPKVFGSYNFGVRKNIFEQVGGFDATYRYASGEDNDLSYRILNAGYKIYFEKEALVDHFYPVSLGKYLREQYRHGFWRFKMYCEHPSMARGDDYTFWKDGAELAGVIAIIASALAATFGIPFFLLLTVGLVTFLCLLEFFFGFRITKNFFEAIYLSWVMFLRSFVRAFGFSSGICCFWLRKKSKKT